MHPSCAPETLPEHYTRSSKYQLRTNSTKTAASDTWETTFLVLALGFHVVGVGCRDKDSPQIVCTGAVLDFQIRLLPVVGDSSSSFSVAALASGLQGVAVDWILFDIYLRCFLGPSGPRRIISRTSFNFRKVEKSYVS